jgi:hypothetical protein
MSVTVAYVLFGPKAKVDTAAVVADIAGKWPDLKVEPSAEAKDGQTAFDIDGQFVVGQMIDAPMPLSTDELDALCAKSLLWPKAKNLLRAHAAHMIVTSFSRDDDDPVERAKRVTYATAGVLGACPQALGVYWGDANHLIKGDLFQEMAAEMLPDSLPLWLWVATLVGKGDDGTQGCTVGMKALGHMELETTNASDGVGDLRERFHALARYLIENGPVIQDGNTVGADENEKIQVIYSDSQFGHEGQVMRLDYQPVRKHR